MAERSMQTENDSKERFMPLDKKKNGNASHFRYAWESFLTLMNIL
jgi:hypothetical protein